MPWDAKEFEAASDDFEKSGVAERRLSLLSAPLCGSVLELGAGIGATWKSGAYNDSARFPRVVISEPEDAMRKKLEDRINEAGKGEDHIQVVNAKLPQLPFKDEEFDVVAIFFALSHVSKKNDSVKEMVRVVKKGGLIVVMDHSFHYQNDSGEVKEFENGPPEDLSGEKSKHEDHHKHANEHHHGHGPPQMHQSVTEVVELFQANDNLELRGVYEEFEAATARFGKIRCIQATFLRK